MGKDGDDVTSAGRERRDRIMERTGDVLGRPRRGIGTLVVLGGLVAMVIGVVLAWRASSAGPIKVDTAFTPWGMGGVLAFAIGLLLTAGGRRWPLALIGLVFSAWALVVLTVDGAKLGTEAPAASKAARSRFGTRCRAVPMRASRGFATGWSAPKAKASTY